VRAVRGSPDPAHGLTVGLQSNGDVCRARAQRGSRVRPLPQPLPTTLPDSRDFAGKTSAPATLRGGGHVVPWQRLHLPRGARLRRRGLTLLEVIVATMILAGALAALGEVIRLATRSAAETRDLARAQLLAASTMARVATGEIAPEPVQGGIFPEDPNPDNPSWMYAIAVEPTGDPALIALQVIVTQIVTTGQPVEYSLTRWLPDPNYAAAELSEEATESQSESSSTEAI
jgi:prepilin-type N-terminal cleavage/methylation domain-containing protein